jgi:hypothetical protein
MWRMLNSFCEYDTQTKLYTGKIIIRQKATNPQSLLYNQERTITRDDANCLTYNPLWVTIDTICSVDNIGSHTGEQLLVQRDTNQISDTYNTTRNIPGGTSQQCINSMPNWQNIGNPECVIVNGAYTGDALQQQQDINIASPTYNQVRQINIGNTGNCTNLTIYAGVEIDGNGDTSIPYGGNDDYGEYFYSDIYVHYYTDPNGFNPFTLASNLNINVRETYTISENNGTNNSVQYSNQTVNGQSGQNRTYIGNKLVLHWHNYLVFDGDYEWWVYDEYQYMYEVIPGTGYTVKP